MNSFFKLLAMGAVAGLALPLRAETVDGIRGLVHDSIVSYQEVELLTAQSLNELRRQYARDPETFRQKIGEVRNANLEQLMARQLILHEFKTAGYNLPESVTDEIVEERIKRQYRDRVTATQSLQKEGITYEKFRERVREQFIVEQMRLKNVSSEVIISPHKVEAYYNAHRDDYKVSDEVKLRMIVANKSSDPNEPQAKELAQEIVAKLKEGTPFEEMAAMYSQRTQRSPGGEWFEAKTLRKELADSALPLKPGQYSGVIDLPEACYVVLVEDKRPAHLKTLSEVREEIERNFVLEERTRLERQWIERLRKKTFVRYF